jgi:hypothetical protein
MQAEPVYSARVANPTTQCQSAFKKGTQIMTKLNIVFSGHLGAPRLIVNPVDVGANTLDELIRRAKSFTQYLSHYYYHCMIENDGAIEAEFTFQHKVIVNE